MGLGYPLHLMPVTRFESAEYGPGRLFEIGKSCYVPTVQLITSQVSPQSSSCQSDVRCIISTKSKLTHIAKDGVQLRILGRA